MAAADELASAAAAVAGVEERLEQLRELYAQRSRQLLASLHRAQAENASLREAGASSKRAQYIAALQGHVAERELVVDVLKAALAGAGIPVRPI